MRYAHTAIINTTAPLDNRETAVPLASSSSSSGLQQLSPFSSRPLAVNPGLAWHSASGMNVPLAWCTHMNSFAIQQKSSSSPPHVPPLAGSMCTLCVRLQSFGLLHSPSKASQSSFVLMFMCLSPLPLLLPLSPVDAAEEKIHIVNSVVLRIACRQNRTSGGGVTEVIG